MSYDVYLEGPEREERCVCSDCWNSHVKKTREQFFSANYTSNCAGMWDAAGARLRDWKGRRAGDVVAELREAIWRMSNEPERFDAMAPDNGWGSREGAIRFLSGILEACRKYPDARLHISN